MNLPQSPSAQVSNASHWIVSVAYTDLPSDSRVLREAREAAGSGARVTVLAPRPSCFITSNVPGMEFVWLPVEQERGQTTLLGHARFLRALRRWVQSQAGLPDVVHVHNMPDYLYWPFKRWHQKGVRVVLDVHDIMSELAVHKLHGWRRVVGVWALKMLERAVWRRVDHIVTVHEPYRRRIAEMAGLLNRIAVVLNVPDRTQCRAELRRSPPLGQFKIVFHGTLSSRTGVMHVVRAMPAVVDAVPLARLWIVGDGDGRQELLREIDERGLSRCVCVSSGFLPVGEVIAEICDAHAAVVPNERSTYTDAILPVKFLEYATLGIPAVATKLPVLSEYFADDAAHFISHPEPHLIAQGLIRLAREEDYRQAVGRTAQAAVELHSWSRYATTLREALGLASGHSPESNQWPLTMTGVDGVDR